MPERDLQFILAHASEYPAVATLVKDILAAAAKFIRARKKMKAHDCMIVPDVAECRKHGRTDYISTTKTTVGKHHPRPKK